MKLKIIATGKPDQTKIIDLETGSELNESVIYCKIKFDAETRGQPFVELGLTDVAVDIIAEEVKAGPVGMSGYLGE